MNRRFVSFLSLSVLVAIGATGCSDESSATNTDGVNRSKANLTISEDAEAGSNLSEKEPELGSESDNAADSDKADSEPKQTVNATGSDSLATNPSANQDAADSSNYDVCEKMDKRDVLYFPDYYNEDTAEAILIDPQLHLSSKLTIDDKERLRKYGEHVAYRGDLNPDVRIDFITRDHKNSYSVLAPYNVYINCGNNQVVGSMLEYSPSAPRKPSVIDSGSSGWKVITFYNVDASTKPKVDYDASYGPYYGYNVTYKFQYGFYEVIRKVEAENYKYNF